MPSNIFAIYLFCHIAIRVLLPGAIVAFLLRTLAWIFNGNVISWWWPGGLFLGAMGFVALGVTLDVMHPSKRKHR